MASSPTPQQAWQQIVHLINNGDDLPSIILLAGLESYYTDRISKVIIEEYIPEVDRPTQLLQYFGPETTTTELLQSAQTSSMFTSRRLIVVREAHQLISKQVHKVKYCVENLILDAPTIAPCTTLLLLYRDKVSAAIKKAADSNPDLTLLVDSPTLMRERDVKEALVLMTKELGLTLDSSAREALCDLVGFDLSSLYNELRKISLATKISGGKVSRDTVLKMVGMSREYNPYDLLRAIQNGRADDAIKIGLHMADNQKRYPLPQILAILYSFFANLLIVHSLGHPSAQQVLTHLNLEKEFQAKNLLAAQRRYSQVQTRQIISAIRTADVAFKGADGSSLPPRAIIEDLLAQIFSFHY